MVVICSLLDNVSKRFEQANTETAKWKNARNLALLDILICTGIRIEEASNIALSDIISSEHTILIHGKGRKQRLIYISCQDTWHNLTQWLKYRNKIELHTDKLFVNRYGNQISIHGIEYIFKNIKQSAKINAKATPHCLRHTFATRCVEVGFEIKSLSEILGHANVNITLNRYVHSSLELKHINMNKLVFQ